jgi:DNA primase
MSKKILKVASYSITELKNNTDIVDVFEYLGHRLEQKEFQKNPREYWGNSPFLDKETKSLKVNDETGLWFDFETGKGGDVFDFVMQIRKCDFMTAVVNVASIHDFPLVFIYDYPHSGR